ncbi:DUF3800 domain-containing protein, partial [Salmonella enterica]|nr:DUF3800 domain-containing protein [Salmonella enterica]
YIDESGNFSLKNSTWNSVGILAIPHQKEEEIASFVKTLKNKIGIKKDDELKIISEEILIKFFDELIDFLHEKKSVFHMSSIHSRNISEEILNKIKSNLANSIIKSAGDDIRKSDVIERINSLSNQNFC